MSHDNATSANRENTGPNPVGSHDSHRHVDTIDAEPSRPHGNTLTNGNGTRHVNVGKSDSEAETVVLSGKEEGPATARRKAIKHEDTSDDEERGERIARKRGLHNGDNLHGHGPNGVSKPSLKRKRVVQEIMTSEGLEGGNSSNLSSAYSSPGPQAPSDKAHGCDSDQSRSSPPAEEDIRRKKGRLRKRKLESGNDQAERKRRGKSDPSSEIVNGKEQRESRRAELHEVSSGRSVSPPITQNQHLRTHSMQSSNIHNGVKKKKAPPSLSIDSRRKTSDSTGPDSDDSSGPRSRPRLHKSASVDEPMTSKLSHKKILDRSGRTPVARACATDNIEQLTAELKERPQHLNEPDYAKNTPLQIAALEGFVNTVRYLIKEGCIVNCKNIDGDTPLIDAVENGHLEVVDLLLNAGADPRLRNGKGFEPLDLVNIENDYFEEIRSALVTAKAKHSMRRPSEDQAGGFNDNDGGPASAPGGSPTDSLQTQGSKGAGEASTKPHSGKSINAEGDAARRKTARRQATREDLLWVSSTPARLRDAASKGDMAIVVQCLNNLVKADTESMLAAARGGHDDVLDILIAMGEPEHDPEPLESSNYKAGNNTPMLAAIGGGNIKVIKLLLSQREFDPTRRMYHGYTYYELAKQRGSPIWQEEYEVLKEAYDNHSNNGNRRSLHSSPRKNYSKRSESSSSPLVSLTSDRHVESLRGGGGDHPHKTSSHKHLHPNDSERKGSSAIISDREADSPGPTKPKSRNGRSSSDVGFRSNSNQEPSLKPRRRLLSKNEIQSDHDIKRRASLAAEKPPRPSHEEPTRVSTNSPDARAQDRKYLQDASSQREGNKKRPRTSNSPQGSVSEITATCDIVKKKKRQRVDSEGNAIEQEPAEPMPRGPAMVANMIASPELALSPIKTPGTAPVAFMGGNTTSPTVARSPVNTRGSMNPPIGSLDPSLVGDVAVPQASSPRYDENVTRLPGQENGHIPMTSEETRTSERSVCVSFPADRDTRATAAESAQEEEIAREKEVRAVSQQEEAARKAQREEAEREEQEARAAKKRDEELQMQMRRAEQERQQKEKEERRRAEQEHREEQRRIRLQEEQELQRRDLLPFGLRRAAELSPDEARDPGFFQNFLPLYYVTTEDLDPDCDKEEVLERWIANVQVAPILANKDLELSQFITWERRPLTMDQRGSLWRQLCNQQSGVRIAELLKQTSEKDLIAESKRKFFTTLESIFWLKHSDFLDIIPRHPHLAGMSLTTRHMALHDHPFGIGGTWDDEKPEGRMSVGQKRKREEENVAVTTAQDHPHLPATNGDLPNGHM